MLTISIGLWYVGVCTPLTSTVPTFQLFTVALLKASCEEPNTKCCMEWPTHTVHSCLDNAHMIDASYVRHNQAMCYISYYLYTSLDTVHVFTAASPSPSMANLAAPVHVQSPALATQIVAYEVLITAVHEGYTAHGAKWVQVEETALVCNTTTTLHGYSHSLARTWHALGMLSHLFSCGPEQLPHPSGSC